MSKKYTVTPAKTGDDNNNNNHVNLQNGKNHSYWFELLEDPSSSKEAQWLANFLTLSVILSIIFFCIDTEPAVNEICSYECGITIDLIFVFIFTVEFGLRMYVYHYDHKATIKEFISDFLNIVDFIAIVPSYIEVLIWGAQYNFQQGGGPEVMLLRIMKLCKVFRVFKLMKHFNGTDVLIKTMWDSADALTIPFFFLVLFNLIFASVMFTIESADAKIDESGNLLIDGTTPVFENIASTFYFMIVTMTTTGYGDQTPVSPLGRIIAAFAAIFGILFLAMPLTIVGTSFYNNWNAHLKKLADAKEAHEVRKKQKDMAKKRRDSMSAKDLDQLIEEGEVLGEELIVPSRLNGQQRDFLTTYFQTTVGLTKLKASLEDMRKKAIKAVNDDLIDSFYLEMSTFYGEIKAIYINVISMKSIVSRAVKLRGLALFRRASNKVLLDVKMRRWASMYNRAEGVAENCQIAEEGKRGWKDRVYLLLEVPESSKTAQHIAHFSIVVIIASIMVFIIESDHTMHGKNGLSGLQWFILELFFTVLFSVEFVLRAMVTPNQAVFWKDTLNWFDLVAIVPFYIELLVALIAGVIPWETTTEGAVGQVLKMVKLCRVLRVFKMTRQFSGSKLLWQTAVYSIRALTVPMFFLLVFVLLFAAMLYYLEPGEWDTNGNYVKDSGEPNEFTSIFSCFWLIIITITTVGYGDISPTTVPGKLVCVAAMIFGILYTAMPLAIVGSFFFDAYDEEKKDLENPKEILTKLDKLLTETAKTGGQNFLNGGLKNMVNAKNKFSAMIGMKDTVSKKSSGGSSMLKQALKGLQNAESNSTLSSTVSNTINNATNSSPTDDESKGQEESSTYNNTVTTRTDRLNAEQLDIQFQSIIKDVNAALLSTYELTEMVQCISTKYIEREFSIHKEL